MIDAIGLRVEAVLCRERIEPTLRRLELARVAGSAPGVAYLAELTIDGAETDLELDGVAALPAALDDPTDPSTITGTVS